MVPGLRKIPIHRHKVQILAFIGCGKARVRPQQGRRLQTTSGHCSTAGRYCSASPTTPCQMAHGSVGRLELSKHVYWSRSATPYKE